MESVRIHVLKLKNQAITIMKNQTFLLVVFTVLSLGMLQAQDLKFSDLDKSPMDAAHYPRTSAFNNYMKADQKKPRQIKVLYCRPYKKDRVVFGKLVPYGKEWRLGANEATEVTFAVPVEIGGKFINRGTYTMFADVHPNYWVIKISKERFIGGNSNRDVTQDIVAAKAPVTNVADSREQFTIGFQKVNDGNCNMVFAWDRTQATLPINLNPTFLAGEDKSPMDLAQYPSRSRLRNFLKKEELAENEPQVRVVYARPQKRGRKIFGELLKYGELWRLGANETTEITFFNDVTINGKAIKKGTYGIMATVHKDKWDVVIHKNIPSWGVANHDESKNVVSLTVPTEKTPKDLEALSVTYEKKGGNELHLIIGWEKTMVRVPIMLKP